MAVIRMGLGAYHPQVSACTLSGLSTPSCLVNVGATWMECKRLCFGDVKHFYRLSSNAINLFGLFPNPVQNWELCFRRHSALFPIDWLKQVLQFLLSPQHYGKGSEVSCWLDFRLWGRCRIAYFLQNAIWH